MAVELVTGYSGTEHVSSSDDGARQAGTVGTGMYVLETVEDPLAATLENANTVTVGPGDVLINGRHVRLTGSTTYAVPVGTQAMQTSNLLVLRYSVSDDGTEKVEAVTLTGEPAASDPQDPALATGSILDGDSPVDMALYRVVTTGIESAQPVRLFSTVPPIAGLPGVGENVLDVAHGGTGMTSEPSLLVNLGSTSPAPSFQESPRPGVTGTLPVARGGTGATNAGAVRANLQLVGVSTASTTAFVGKGGDADQRVLVTVNTSSGNYIYVVSDYYHGLINSKTQGWVWRKILSGVSQNGLDAYPIGAVYISYVPTSPASLFGGTWTPITGRFPYFNAGTGTGGSNTHTLTVQEMPSHSHSDLVGYNRNTGGTDSLDFGPNAYASLSTSFTSHVGGGTAHNNMPAYQTFYAWRRTA